MTRDSLLVTAACWLLGVGCWFSCLFPSRAFLAVGRLSVVRCLLLVDCRWLLVFGCGCYVFGCLVCLLVGRFVCCCSVISLSLVARACIQVPSRCICVPGGSQGFYSAAQGVYLDAQGLHLGAQGIHLGAEGLHLVAQGLHLVAKGLHLGAQGLLLGAQALHLDAQNCIWVHRGHIWVHRGCM